MVKGHKVFNQNWTRLGFQYKVGKIYKQDGDPIVCNHGFHFCKQAKTCFNYYSFNPRNKVSEFTGISV